MSKKVEREDKVLANKNGKCDQVNSSIPRSANTSWQWGYPSTTKGWINPNVPTEEVNLPRYSTHKSRPTAEEDTRRSRDHTTGRRTTSVHPKAAASHSPRRHSEPAASLTKHSQIPSK